jgi:endonuclease/exonuclease/phosphatase family metal-dependent hydrolase
MSYNVHNFHGKDDRTSQTDTNAATFIEQVRDNTPDILCLMEYSSGNKVRVTDSLTSLGYNHYHGAHGSNASPSGTVVFSKLPITYVKRIDHNMLLVELMHDEQHFRLCCVHLDSYALDSINRKEIEQMLHGEVKTESQTLDKVKETVRKHESEWNEKLEPIVSESSMPMLLAGDFNDIPSSWLYAQVCKHLDDTYRDKGTGICRTYNGNGFPHFRIDYVFHSKEFQTLSYKRLKIDISDHYPVITSLELAK